MKNNTEKIIDYIKSKKLNLTEFLSTLNLDEKLYDYETDVTNILIEKLKEKELLDLCKNKKIPYKKNNFIIAYNKNYFEFCEEIIIQNKVNERQLGLILKDMLIKKFNDLYVNNVLEFQFEKEKEFLIKMNVNQESINKYFLEKVLMLADVENFKKIDKKLNLETFITHSIHDFNRFAINNKINTDLMFYLYEKKYIDKEFFDNIMTIGENKIREFCLYKKYDYIFKNIKKLNKNLLHILYNDKCHFKQYDFFSITEDKKTINRIKEYVNDKQNLLIESNEVIALNKFEIEEIEYISNLLIKHKQGKIIEIENNENINNIDYKKINILMKNYCKVRFIKEEIYNKIMLTRSLIQDLEKKSKINKL